MKTLGFMAAAAAMLVTVGDARADEDKEIAIANLLSPLGNAVRWEKPSSGWGGGGDEIKEVVESCRAGIAEAKAAGVKPNDVVKAWKGFEKNPKATVKGDDVTFKFKDAGWYCDDLEQRTKHWDLILRLQDAVKYEKRVAEGLTDTEKGDIEPSLIEYTRELQKRCEDALAAELATGATTIDVDGTKMKLSDVPARCAIFDAWGDLQDEAWKVRAEEVGAKYRAVGIQGDRLELFIYYDDLEGWYLKGCKKSTMDPKALKKAKALFQWLTDSAGVITIRKYAFKGDKYKVTEKQFLTEAKAYKGCK